MGKYIKSHVIALINNKLLNPEKAKFRELLNMSKIFTIIILLEINEIDIYLYIFTS